MKLRLFLSMLLFALTNMVFASDNTIPCVPNTACGQFYMGAFGGGGSSHKLKGSQFGTAFYPEVQGGPLAVDAFGHLKNKNTAFFGVQLGYQAKEICLNPCSEWTLGVAAELEGYFTNKNRVKGAFSNVTSRLPEHDFIVSYRMNRSVFLTNAVISFNSPCFFVRPYIGLGMGNAIVRISDANAAQISPPEAGVNHYNSDNKDSISTFAGQIKLGLIYDINPCISVFAEYRWLYLARTHFLFGSTVYPNHFETTGWHVRLNDQKYNLGSIGIRYHFY